MAWADNEDYTTSYTEVLDYANNVWDGNAETWDPTIAGWRLVLRNSQVGSNGVTEWQETYNPNGVEHQKTGLLNYINNVNPIWRRIYKLQSYATANSLLQEDGYSLLQEDSYLILLE